MTTCCFGLLNLPPPGCRLHEGKDSAFQDRAWLSAPTGGRKEEMEEEGGEAGVGWDEDRIIPSLTQGGSQCGKRKTHCANARETAKHYGNAQEKNGVLPGEVAWDPWKRGRMSLQREGPKPEVENSHKTISYGEAGFAWK